MTATRHLNAYTKIKALMWGFVNDRRPNDVKYVPQFGNDGIFLTILPTLSCKTLPTTSTEIPSSTPTVNATNISENQSSAPSKGPTNWNSTTSFTEVEFITSNDVAFENATRNRSYWYSPKILV